MVEFEIQGEWSHAT